MSKIKRKTTFMVYVGAEALDKPQSVFDASYAHLVKKDYPIGKRKEFMALYMKAVGEEAKLALVDEWVQVRDIKTFPFRKKAEVKVISASTKPVKGGKSTAVIMDDEEDPFDDTSNPGVKGAKAGAKLREELDASDNKMDIHDEETNEDSETEGGVPVDDGADGEQESGTASK